MHVFATAAMEQEGMAQLEGHRMAGLCPNDIVEVDWLLSPKTAQSPQHSWTDYACVLSRTIFVS